MRAAFRRSAGVPDRHRCDFFRHRCRFERPASAFAVATLPRGTATMPLETASNAVKRLDQAAPGARTMSATRA